MNIKKFKLIFIGCCNKDQTHFIIFTRLANRSFSLDCGAQGKCWSKQPSSSYQHTFHNYNKCQSQKYNAEFWSLNFFLKLNILIRIFKLILKIYIIYMHMVNLHFWSHGNFTMAWTLGFKLITHCLCNPTIRCRCANDCIYHVVSSKCFAKINFNYHYIFHTISKWKTLSFILKDFFKMYTSLIF